MQLFIFVSAAIPAETVSETGVSGWRLTSPTVCSLNYMSDYSLMIIDHKKLK